MSELDVWIGGACALIAAIVWFVSWYYEAARYRIVCVDHDKLRFYAIESREWIWFWKRELGKIFSTEQDAVDELEQMVNSHYLPKTYVVSTYRMYAGELIGLNRFEEKR